MQGEQVRVICDDTDVFILPQVYKCSPVADCSIVDLGATAQKNKDMSKAILVMHAPTGTDTVAVTYNVGKRLALKALQTIDPESLSIIGDPHAILN